MPSLLLEDAQSSTCIPGGKKKKLECQCLLSTYYVPGTGQTASKYYVISFDPFKRSEHHHSHFAKKEAGVKGLQDCTRITEVRGESSDSKTQPLHHHTPQPSLRNLACFEQY